MLLIDFFSDRKLLIGIGIGIVAATFVMLGTKVSYQMSRAQIEDKARGMGMIYPQEVKVINDKGVSK
ncbi:hypothetical protein D4Z93_09035 [Clostridium fermenticellae]|uniref:Uncharacterized protein n=1 Tax=Clostridium fermenticellae TaxID=2068654 RepID=A0A386H4S3_9CLOT|nr:hypothetical protein [Clostridium fermenticellae]AYD40666.1 hypothetical protein D4Z93_09035 [Clostridium fermenticellae]